jgi:hypothetical protein
LYIGVIVKVTVTGELVVFVKAPLIVFPEPLSAMPVTVVVLFRVQVKVVPAGFPVATIGLISSPVHIDWLCGVTDAVGIGFTTTVAEPVIVLEQFGAVWKATLPSAYSKLPAVLVGTETVAVLFADTLIVCSELFLV